ncbi:hypothetical protein SETIT_1G234100v2 [Setaria italica]|uniref:Leucine-rich repeat-containing N-terminal plant-type domain-containing protein n=1 Tax=Setaria italica TaxID=4555 RepID=A0A368PNI8_SETIT|nr:uncharacterized protein At4g06744 [Setaria italica]RCV07315.1 hypothetical protein SETIT_1G234100v2 [Setaria italica]
MSLDLSLPLDLGFSKLSYLAVFDNKLTGHLPSSIGHLQDSLFEVLLLNNQLSDCLPHELGMLNKAAVIDAGMNQLTGPIPASFSCISSVEQLNLGGNRLYGQIGGAGMRGANQRRRAGREEQLHSRPRQPEAPGGVRGVPEPAQDVPGGDHSGGMSRRTCRRAGGEECHQGLLRLRDVRYSA